MNGLMLTTLQVENEGASDVWEGWGSVILVAGSTLLVLIIVGILIWQVLKIQQTKAMNAGDVAREEAYRKLAEEATSVQNRTAAELNQLTEGVADLRVRVASIERMLREVE